MKPSLGYFSANDSSWHIHLSSQNLILSPPPTFHFNPVWITVPWCEWWRALFKSLHQIDSGPTLPVSSILLHPPYLDSNTLVHNFPWCCKRCHFHLSRRAILKVLMSLMPSPPFSFDKHTVSYLIHAILFWSGPPPHKNLRCNFISLSTTDWGTLKKEKK